MISAKVKEILSEGVDEEVEATVLFIEEGELFARYSNFFGPGKAPKTRRSRPSGGWAES